MSSSKGNSSRTRSQKYKNKTAFKNDLHDTSNKTKIINSLEVNNVCKRCKDIIEWKIKYKKYKPLTALRKCSQCEGKTVKHAYHVICSPCAKDKQVCAKCCKSAEIVKEVTPESKDDNDIKAILKGLPERKRRTFIRYINKNQDEVQNSTLASKDDMAMQLEKLKLQSGINKNHDDFDFSCEEDLNDSDCSSS